MGSGSPIVQAAALQFGACLRNDLLAEYQFDLGAALAGTFRSEWSYRHGVMHVPDAPGLGIAVIEPELRSHCASVESWSSST